MAYSMIFVGLDVKMFFHDEVSKSRYGVLVKEVADECVRNMTDADRTYIRMHPDTIRYHFGYGMHIRNTYGKCFGSSG